MTGLIDMKLMQKIQLEISDILHGEKYKLNVIESIFILKQILETENIVLDDNKDKALFMTKMKTGMN